MIHWLLWFISELLKISDLIGFFSFYLPLISVIPDSLAPNLLCSPHPSSNIFSLTGILYKIVRLFLTIIKWWQTASFPGKNLKISSKRYSKYKFWEPVHPEDSKTPSTYWNWLSFDWDIWGQRQIVWF